MVETKHVYKDLKGLVLKAVIKWWIDWAHMQNPIMGVSSDETPVAARVSGRGATWSASISSSEVIVSGALPVVSLGPAREASPLRAPNTETRSWAVAVMVGWGR